MDKVIHGLLFIGVELELAYNKKWRNKREKENGDGKKK